MTDLGSFNKHILLKEKNIIPLMQGGMGVGVSFSGLAGAVASSLQIAIAFGPSRCLQSSSQGVPLNAKFIIVFLYTL